MSQSQAMAAVTSEVDWRSERLRGERGRDEEETEEEEGGKKWEVIAFQ